MPALTKTSSSRPTPPWRPHNRNSPPQQGKGGNAAAAMTPACPKPTKNQSYAEPVQLSRPEYPSQSPNHHADPQISPITLKSSASKTPREKSGSIVTDAPAHRRRHPAGGRGGRIWRYFRSAHAHRGHAGGTGGLAKRPDGFRRRIPHLGVRAGKSHLINGLLSDCRRRRDRSTGLLWPSTRRRAGPRDTPLAIVLAAVTT